MGQCVKKTLLGKELIFTEQMDSFNSLRKKYLMLSTEAKEKAEKTYDELIHDYSSYVSDCQMLMDEIFDRYLQIGVLDIIKFGIYDIDEVVLQEELEQEFGSDYRHAIADFVGKIYKIDAEQAQADEDRKEMIRDAGPIEGSYVSMSGNIASDLGNVVGSQIETAAINAVFKGGTALLTKGVRAIEKKRAESEKKDLFSSRGTKKDLIDGMETDVYILHRTIARLINERIGVDYFYYAKEEDIDRYEPVCRNILRGNFKNDNDVSLEIEQIHEVLRMNPYEMRMYGYILSKNGDITDEMMTLMDYLCVDKSSLASSYLETKYDLNDYNIYEKIVEFEKVVVAELETFSIVGCAFADKVAAKKETLFIERRTFHQFTYDTIEERDFAEKQYNDFVGNGFAEQNLDELLGKYDETYVQDLLASNSIYIRQEILQFVETVVDEFKDSDSLSIYVVYAKKIKKEHELEKLDILDVIEKKYKQLVRKEKIEAKVADIKGKIIAFFKNFKNNIKHLWQKLMVKLPFGKKRSVGKKKSVVKKKKAKEPIDSSAVVVENKIEAFIETVVEPEVATREVAAPEVIASEVTVTPVVEVKVCPQCGNQLKVTAKFCGKCGHRF